MCVYGVQNCIPLTVESVILDTTDVSVLKWRQCKMALHLGPHT